MRKLSRSNSKGYRSCRGPKHRADIHQPFLKKHYSTTGMWQLIKARGLNSAPALAGAGAGIARRFAREGFKVALVSRKQETLAPIAQEIAGSGGQALSVPADTGKPSARQHLFVCRYH